MCLRLQEAGWCVRHRSPTLNTRHNNKLRTGSVQTHPAFPFLSSVIQVIVAPDTLLSIDSECLLDCFSITVFPDTDAGAGEIWHPVLKSLFTQCWHGFSLCNAYCISARLLSMCLTKSYREMFGRVKKCIIMFVTESSQDLS